MSDTVITVENLGKKYTIGHRRERLGIIGRNGAGKSTLFGLTELTAK